MMFNKKKALKQKEVEIHVTKLLDQVSRGEMPTADEAMKQIFGKEYKVTKEESF